MKRKQKNKLVVKLQRLRWSRNIIQILSFILVPALFSQAFGGVKEIFTAIGEGKPLLWSAFTVRLIALCGATVVIGRFFCGWMCAFGALGDWIYQFSELIHKKRKKKRKIQISEKAHRVLQKLKYVVLAGMALLCFFGENAFITQNSPWTVFSFITVGNLKMANHIVASVILIFILIGMGIQERFFCQYLCPMGAIFSLLPELPFLKLYRSKENCISHCQLCKKQCPVRMKITENSMEEGECIRCARCIVSCPGKNIGLPVIKKKTGQKSHLHKCP